MSLFNQILFLAEVILSSVSFFVKITVKNPLKISQKVHRPPRSLILRPPFFSLEPSLSLIHLFYWSVRLIGNGIVGYQTLVLERLPGRSKKFKMADNCFVGRYFATWEHFRSTTASFKRRELAKEVIFFISTVGNMAKSQ